MAARVAAAFFAASTRLGSAAFFGAAFFAAGFFAAAFFGAAAFFAAGFFAAAFFAAGFFAAAFFGAAAFFAAAFFGAAAFLAAGFFAAAFFGAAAFFAAGFFAAAFFGAAAFFAATRARAVAGLAVRRPVAIAIAIARGAFSGVSVLSVTVDLLAARVARHLWGIETDPAAAPSRGDGRYRPVQAGIPAKEKGPARPMRLRPASGDGLMPFLRTTREASPIGP
ncbi:MAG: hypothetical protein N3D18_03190 [Roseococcus sp.]|nr:hypothetical protein [Roseococcus sp.]